MSLGGQHHVIHTSCLCVSFVCLPAAVRRAVSTTEALGERAATRAPPRILTSTTPAYAVIMSASGVPRLRIGGGDLQATTA